MKKTLILFSLALATSLSAPFSLLAQAQVTYEPQILVLSPGKMSYDKALSKEITHLDNETKSHKNVQGKMDPKDVKDGPANLQKMAASESAYLKNLDFSKMASLISEEFLTYKFFEKFPTLLVLLKDTQTNGRLDELKGIAEASGLQYVLNFPEIKFYRQDGISYARLTVQFYDHSTNALLIDTAYTGNSDNPGFEFACPVGTLNCTINNSLSQALESIVYQVAENSPTIQRERVVWRDRLKILRSDYYPKPFDRSFISSIIPAADSNIALDHLYQLLVNDDQTKFVGFFLEKRDKRNFKQFTEDHSDKDVKIENNKSIQDTGYLNAIPQTYAYIVKAVKYQGKWYYEKSNVTYFEPQDNEGGKLQYFNTLQERGFFKDNAADISPGFWETHLFGKIRDLRLDPDWSKYGDNIWRSEEEENRPYIGLYEIVADKLKGKKSVAPTHITIN
jgi:hypothetical protein